MKDNNQKPSLKEYVAFHGMLCRPKTAYRVIQSFQGGALLFASQKDYDDYVAGESNLSDFDFNIGPIGLNIWTYYLLVLVSLTGFCSVVGSTKLIKAIEYENSCENEDKHCDTTLQFEKGDKTCIESSDTASTFPLRLPPKAMDYVIDESFRMSSGSTKSTINEGTYKNSVAGKSQSPKLALVRRFEYDFGGFLSVMMLHFMCTNGRIHLVEIYRFNTRATAGVIAKMMSTLLNGIKSLLITLRQRQEPVDDSKKTS